jgi:hypothetical protein
MAQPLLRQLKAAAFASASLLGLSLLGSCQNPFGRANIGDQKAPQADQLQGHGNKPMVQECLAKQATLIRLTDQLETVAKAKTTLGKAVFTSTPEPEAPEPSVLRRYTISDQELELERHEQAVLRWRRDEEKRRRLWTQQQQRQRSDLEQQQETLLKQLETLNPALISVQPERQVKAEAVEAFRNCDPKALASLSGSSEIPAPAVPAPGISKDGV